MSPGTSTVVWRARLLAGVLLLSAVAFRQSPGLVVPDTKLDLTANPGGFLARALNMWDPQGAFGQLQNQAYGYLFPAGPFHWLLTTFDVPAWVVQRLWWTVVLATAFLGLWRLAGALGLGTPWARFGGALLYALTPRFLGEVAITSVEVWPIAVAPWVLLPLVDPRERSWAWRISRSALAFAFVGGVNAVATGATLVLPTLWFATRRGLRRALGWYAVWLASVVAVSLWWLVPLVLLGRYSPPFLDWIENAAVTTAFASPFEALRGTTQWLNYLTGSGGPSWPAGWQFVTRPSLIVLTALTAGLGLAGIRLAPARVRTFLTVSAVVGLALVTLGHTGAAASPAAPVMQPLLDGVLAAARNTHKFELVVRLPLALGLVQGLAAAARAARRARLAPWLAPVMAASCLLATGAPALAGTLARPEGYAAIPQHWRDAAGWLDAQPGPGTVLVTPGAGFADFTWGSTKDEPLQALMQRPFAVRDAVPLGSAGATRVLDGIEDRLSSGQGGPGLRTALRSAGIRYVVVRNDLRADAAGNVGLLLHQALADAGLTRAASFGPRVGQAAETPTQTVDSRTRLPYQSVEIFDVGTPPAALVVPSAALVRASGGPEDVPDVLRAMPAAGAVLTGSDGAPFPSAPLAITDGNQRREVFFGRAAGNSSQVLAAEDAGRTQRRVTSYLSDPQAPQVVRQWDGGLRYVTASSSASDANATLRRGPGSGPQAAVDGDPRTAWTSGRYARAAGEWLELGFRRPVEVTGASVSFDTGGPLGGAPIAVRVDTARGSATSVLEPGSGAQALATPPGVTQRLRVTVTRTQAGRPANGVSIAEVTVPGVQLGTRLAVPASDGAPPSAIVLRGTGRGAPQCARVGERPLCAAGLGRAAESEGGIRRTVEVPGAATLRFSGTVRPRDGDAVERLLDGLTAVSASASSRGVLASAGRPEAAVDGELGTGWVASADDTQPTLTLTMPQQVTTGSAQFQNDQYLAASRPTRVALTFDGADTETVDIDGEGYARWDPRPFTSLRIRVLETEPMRTVEATTGYAETLPAGVSEVVLTGVRLPKPRLGPSTPTGVACGFGPSVVVGGTALPTRVSGTVGDILAGAALSWSLCTADVTFTPGTTTIDAPQSAEFRPDELTFAQGEPSRVATPVAASVEQVSPAHLKVRAPGATAGSLLVLPANHNAGWEATDGSGRVLQPVRVNGWQQGWQLSGESGTVTARFTPNSGYRAGLAVGADMVILCGLLVFLTRRRRPGFLGRPVTRPLPSASVRRGWVALALPVVLALVAGPLGLLAGLVGAAAAVVWSRRGMALLALGAGLTAGMLAGSSSWPDANAGVDSAVVQLAALLAVAAAVSGVAGDGPGRSARRPRRMIGRSRA
jgi:arabinofuranan 3-O-arabinosyltransferase